MIWKVFTALLPSLVRLGKEALRSNDGKAKPTRRNIEDLTEQLRANRERRDAELKAAQQEV